MKDGLSVRLESDPFLPGVVIARNPGVIGQVDGKEVIDGVTEKISWNKKKAKLKL